MTKKQILKAEVQISNAHNLLSLILETTISGKGEITSPAYGEMTVPQAISAALDSVDAAFKTLASHL